MAIITKKIAENALITKPGVMLSGKMVSFSFDCSGFKKVDLQLIDPNSGKCVKSFQMTGSSRLGTLKTISLDPNEIKGLAYRYDCDGKTVTDPFAVCIRDGLCYPPSSHPMVMPMERDASDLTNMTLYKLHVRGFTKQAKISEALRGTFKGLEKKLDYIRDLGFTAVEMMPVYTFSQILTEPATGDVRPGVSNYWGYSTDNYYFAPDERYCGTNDPETEFAHLVSTMHNKGLACYLEFYLPSGTDIFLVREVLHYWRLNYGVDGFRLFGGGEAAYFLLKDPLLKTAHLIFEYLDDGCMEIAKKRSMPVSLENAGYRFMMREAIKGDEGKMGDLASRMLNNAMGCRPINDMANVNGMTLYDSVSYNYKHNEANDEGNRDGGDYDASWNCGEEGATAKRQIRQLRMKQMKNALACLYLSQGIPLVMQGDERLNTQLGNNNAYGCDNEIGWISWKEDRQTKQLREFVKDMADLRNRFPMLHQALPLREVDYKAYGTPDVSFHEKRAWYHSFDRRSHSIALMYNLRYAGEEGYLYIAINTADESDMGIPALKDADSWSLLMCTDEADRSVFADDPRPLGDIRSYRAPERSVSVLFGKKDTITKKDISE